MTNDITAFQKTINHSKEWIFDLMAAYDFSDENKAFVLLRSTLKALRDRISSGEAFHLGSQLPVLIRGYFYEDWNPHKGTSKDHSVEDFLTTVRKYLGGHDDIDLNVAVPEALRIIFEKIDKGEAEDVKHNLPKEIQELCP